MCIKSQDEYSSGHTDLIAWSTDSGSIWAGLGSESIAPTGKVILPYGKQAETDIFYNRDIFVKALVLRVGKLEVALVEMDVIGIVYEAAEAIKAKISQESGIPSDNILLGATHNHSYPRVRDPEVLCLLAEQSARAVKSARNNMFPAMIGTAKGTMPENMVINRSSAFGEINSEVTVIRIDDLAGYARAVIFNCGIHPTCFTTSWGDDKTGMIGPEWPEYVRRQIAFYLASRYDYDRHAAGMPYETSFAMFTLGAAGDQQASLWLDEAGGGKVPVLKAFTDSLSRSITNIIDWIITKPTADMTFKWKTVTKNILSRDKVYGERKTLVQLLSINDTAFVAIPGELVYNLGKEIISLSPYKYTAIITCANDYLPGYIVSDEESREAITFEAKDWCEPTEIGSIIVAAVDSLFSCRYSGKTSCYIPKSLEFGSISGTIRCRSDRNFVIGVMNKIEDPPTTPAFWGKRVLAGPDGSYHIDQLIPGKKYIYVKEVTKDYSGQTGQDINTITYGKPVSIIPGSTTFIDFEFPPDLYYTEIKSIELETINIRAGGCGIDGKVKITGLIQEEEKIEARLYYAGMARYLNLSGNLRESAYLDNIVASCLVDDTGRFSFDNVLPGMYVLGFWLDVNRNGMVEPGIDVISKLSKPFIVG